MNKNMKRVLSLVLAFVMMIGMMVPSFADNTAPEVNKKAFTMKVKDEFDNVLGHNPSTLKGQVSVSYKMKAVGADTFGDVMPLTADGTGLFTIDPLAKSTEYQVTVNVAGIVLEDGGKSAYYVEKDAKDQAVYEKTFTFSTDEKGNINGDTYAGMYTFPVKSMSGTNNFANITKYFIQVNRINPENKANRIPVKGVPVKLYKAEFDEKTKQYVADMTTPAIELGTSSDKDGQVVINVAKHMVNNEWDGKIYFNGEEGTLYDNGQLFMAVTEDAVNSTEGLVKSQSLIDLWQYNGKERVFNEDTHKLALPDAKDRQLDLKSEARQFEIVLQNKMVNIIVKVFNNGVTPAIRKPVEGAEIALYNVVGPNSLNLTKVQDSDFSEVAKAKTNAEGMVVFENVDWSKAVSYWYPTANNDGIENIKMPYAVKQLSAPEGLTPYVGYILMNGYYANGGHTVKGKDGLVVSRELDGKDLIIEIENHADAFNYEGRIFGKDRYATAVEIAKKAYPELKATAENFNRKTVVLAQGHQFSDSLVAGPVAEVSSAPILLTAQNSLPQVTLDYLVDMGVEQVIIMGGSNTVSDAVVATLNKAVADGGAGVEHIVRIQGANRYATAVEAGNYLLKSVRDDKRANSRFDFGFTKDNKEGSMVFVANGLSFADALTASVPAAGNGAPILLTDGNKLPMETAKALKDWKIVNAYIIGGEKSVSANEFAEVAKVATARRLAGADRTETSLAVAEKFLSGASHAYFANGMKAADALTGVVLGVKDRAPIILVSGDKVSDNVVEYINNSQLTTGTILGGSNSISTQLRDALSKQINLKK